MAARQRSIVRITSNYVRLLTCFVMGLVLVRVLLQLGTDAFGLIVLLGAGTGLATALREIVRASLIPELGAAFHSGSDSRFRAAFQTAQVICLVAALATFVGFGVLAWTIPRLQIPATLQSAAGFFLWSKAVQSFFTVALAPAFNLYVISERMVAFNAWTVVERAGELLAALSVVLLFPHAEAAQQVMAFGLYSSFFGSLSLLLPVAIMIASDARLRTTTWLVTGQSLRTMLHSVGWNSVVVVAMNMYTRMDMFIMNYLFGLFGNLVFGVAVQLTFYVRQLTMGMVTGVDAVTARLAGNNPAAIRTLLHQSTRLQCLLVFPATVALLVLTKPLLQLWVGPRLQSPGEQLPVIAVLVRILVIGTAARSISEGWMRILSGAGHVRTYAPAVLLGAVFNPAFALLLVNWLPEDRRYAGPALAFTVLLLVVHLFWLPQIVARHFQISLRETVAPLLAPLLVTAVSSLCFLPLFIVGHVAMSSLLMLSGGYLSCCVVLSLIFVLDSRERSRLWNAMGGRHSTVEVSNPDKTELVAADGVRLDTAHGRHAPAATAEQSSRKAVVTVRGSRLAHLGHRDNPSEDNAHKGTTHAPKT
ncbi:MAG: hypothetical protein R3E01_05335 [Pirellulaceae bacterium]|nr:hypothetical protein [Planctomycetales bacterium]